MDELGPDDPRGDARRRRAGAGPAARGSAAVPSAAAQPGQTGWRRCLPAPWLSLGLWGFWLMLNQSLSPGHLVLGAVLALFVPWVSASLRPLRPRIRHPLLAFMIVGHFFRESLRSNWSTARRILGDPGRLRSGFVRIPLRLRDPHALVVLALLINGSPGNTWASLSDDRHEVTLHLLDLDDLDDVTDLVKNRYESLLLKIFESDPAAVADGSPPQGERP